MLAYHRKLGLLLKQLDQPHPAGGILDDDVRCLPLGGERCYSLLHFKDAPMTALDMQQIHLLRIDAHEGHGRVVILDPRLTSRIARQNHAAEFFAWWN